MSNDTTWRAAFFIMLLSILFTLIGIQRELVGLSRLAVLDSHRAFEKVEPAQGMNTYVGDVWADMVKRNEGELHRMDCAVAMPAEPKP